MIYFSTHATWYLFSKKHKYLKKSFSSVLVTLLIRTSCCLSFFHPRKNAFDDNLIKTDKLYPFSSYSHVLNFGIESILECLVYVPKGVGENIC